MAPYHQEGGSTIYHANALEMLRSIPDQTVGAVITDPPYSSGGWSVSERTKAARSTSTKAPGSSSRFRASRVTTVTSAAMATGRHCGSGNACGRPWPAGAVLCSPTGASSPPPLTPYRQAAGCGNGIVVWNKRTARPRSGGFAASCEYVVWGSKGPLRKDHEVYLPGLVTTATARDKSHLAEKPLSLLGVLRAGSANRDRCSGPVHGLGLHAGGRRQGWAAGRRHRTGRGLLRCRRASSRPRGARAARVDNGRFRGSLA